MRFFIILVLTSFQVSFSFAQQEPLFSQYWNAKNYYNPANTGLEAKHLSTTLCRWQDVGVNGSPVIQLLGYAARINKLHGGLGFTYLHEKIGFSDINKAKINYAFHLNLKNNAVLSFGLAAGINHQTLTPEWVPPTTESDPSLPTGFKEAGFTGDLGISYHAEKWNVSLSSTQLTASRIGYYQEKRHFVLMSDYIFGNENGFQFKPQVMVMTDLVKMLGEGSMMLLWKSKLGVAISYRSTKSLIFSAHWDIVKKFRVGYSYDLQMNGLSSISRGSHTGFFGLILGDVKIKDVQSK